MPAQEMGFILGAGVLVAMAKPLPLQRTTLRFHIRFPPPDSRDSLKFICQVGLTSVARWADGRWLQGAGPEATPAASCPRSRVPSPALSPCHSNVNLRACRSW